METCYQYDAVNRMTQQAYYTGSVTAGQTGQCGSIPQANLTATPSVTWAYDDYTHAPNAKMRLNAVKSSAAINSILGYDTLGRITSSNQVIGANTYNFSFTWNSADAMTSITYPAGRVVNTGYDTANRVNQCFSSSWAQSDRTLVRRDHAPSHPPRNIPQCPGPDWRHQRLRA